MYVVFFFCITNTFILLYCNFFHYMSFSICCGLPEDMSMSIYATAVSFVFNIVPGRQEALKIMCRKNKLILKNDGYFLMENEDYHGKCYYYSVTNLNIHISPWSFKPLGEEIKRLFFPLGQKVEIKNNNKKVDIWSIIKCTLKI